MSTETMIKCLNGLQNEPFLLPNQQVDFTPINISLTLPKELYAFDVAMGVIFPDDYKCTLKRLKKDILCPFKFETNHPYTSGSESLIKKIEEWAEENHIRLFTCGYIRGNRWLDDNTEKYFNTLHWQTITEEDAFYISLIWNGKD